MSFLKYQNYKDSGFNWLGKIPSEWTLGKFRHLFSESSEKIESDVHGEMLSVSGYRGIEVKEYSDDNQKRTEESLIGYRIVHKGQLVVNTMWLNYAGLGISQLEGHVSPAYRSYWVNSGLHKPFVHHLMRSSLYVLGYTKYLTGVRPNSLQMGRDDLMSFPIVIPSLEEQKSIASFLDHEVVKIDKLVAEQGKLVELLKEKRQAVISNSITKGIDSSAELIDSGVKWLGKVPKHWKLTSIKHNSTIIGRIGFRGYTKEDIVDEGEGAITLSPSNLIDGDISLSSCTFISWEKFHESPEIQIAPGDVVMVKTGSSYGKVAIFDNSELPEITINPQLVIFKKIKIDSKFFFYFLKSTYLNSLIKSSNTGGTIPTLTQEFLGNIKIVIPTIDEQKLIVDYLNKKNNEFNMLIRESEKVIALLNERKSTLISAAATGQIDVRDYQIKEAR